MILLRSCSLAVAAMLSAALSAQACTDNQFRLHLVDANGVVVPSQIDPVENTPVYLFDTDAVYLAFDPALPSGTYYVHVTDRIGGGLDEVLSANDPLDRFVTVTNNAGVISLSLPFGTAAPVLGLGLGGQGQSIRITPVRTAAVEPCFFKAWYGDAWDLTNGSENPYLLQGGFDPVLGRCRVRSYESFRIGDGTPNDVSGVVFHDLDRDGVRDAGEPGLPGWPVELTTPTSTMPATTDANGRYRFLDVARGTYTVAAGVRAGWIATTSTSPTVQVCGCGDVTVGDFGFASAAMACDGHTIGFWRNKHGKDLVQQHGILATLPGLNLVNAAGQYVAPATLTAWGSYLQGANATNMAYMLSAQLAGMHCNVMSGFVDSQCRIEDARLGNITIAELMQRAIASLALYPLTQSGHAQRGAQELLKNALDAANNNRNWL